MPYSFEQCSIVFFGQKVDVLAKSPPFLQRSSINETHLFSRVQYSLVHYCNWIYKYYCKIFSMPFSYAVVHSESAVALQKLQFPFLSCTVFLLNSDVFLRRRAVFCDSMFILRCCTLWDKRWFLTGSEVVLSRKQVSESGSFFKKDTFFWGQCTV